MAANNGWDFGYSDGELTFGGLTYDFNPDDGPMPETQPEGEAEVVFLEQPKSFPWEYLAAGGFILLLVYAMRR